MGIFKHAMLVFIGLNRAEKVQSILFSFWFFKGSKPVTSSKKIQEFHWQTVFFGWPLNWYLPSRHFLMDSTLVSQPSIFMCKVAVSFRDSKGTGKKLDCNSSRWRISLEPFWVVLVTSWSSVGAAPTCGRLEGGLLFGNYSRGLWSLKRKNQF